MNEEDLLEEVEETMDDEDEATKFTVERPIPSEYGINILAGEATAFIAESFHNLREKPAKWRQIFLKVYIDMTPTRFDVSVYSIKQRPNLPPEAHYIEGYERPVHQPRHDRYQLMPLGDFSSLIANIQRALLADINTKEKELSYTARNYPELCISLEKTTSWKVNWYCHRDEEAPREWWVNDTDVNALLPHMSAVIPIVLEGEV